MSRGNALRVIAVIGPLSAAFFAALPWLGGSPSELRPETQSGLPGFSGPYWGNLIVGIAYGVAAVYVAVSKRF